MARYSSNFGNKLQMMVVKVNNMVLRRILTCRGRLPRAKRSYHAKWQTANQIAERPLNPRVEVEQRSNSVASRHSPRYRKK